jgi:DNA (cytosine-5)-methyltransferase 1
MMRYLSICSGIEAATAAWHPLGWTPAAFAEIDRFPSAALAYHYPAVPNLGDFTRIEAADVGAIDLLVGGTPCQSFSIAGLRGGLADDRGNLALEFLRLAQRTRPRWLVWENVPGVLSSNAGRDFGAILGGMVELGYGFAYRILDAQYFGLAQRRKRVFVVGYLGDWRRAAAVLFERESLSGHPAPRRKARQDVAGTFSSRATAGGGLGTDFECQGGLQVAALAFGGNNTAGAVEVATAVNAKGGTGRSDFESETFIAHALGAEGFDASEDGTGRGTPLVSAPIPIDMRQASRGETMTNNRPDGSSGGAPGTGIGEAGDPSPSLGLSHVPAIAFDCKASGQFGFQHGEIAPTLRAMGHKASHQNAGGQVAVAFHENGRGELTTNETAGSLNAGGGKPGQGYPAIAQNFGVRRLTPRECERLQGFPDDFTLIPWRGKPAELCPDGPRYRALGNSMAVPVMAWIGRGISAVEARP